MTSTVPNVQRVTPATFPSFVTSADFALLHVEVTSPKIPTVVIEHLSTEYPGKFVFGTLRREDAPLPVWWNKHFGAVLGTVTTTWNVRSGFYLFHRGKVACQHSGRKKRTSDEAGATLALHLVGFLFEAKSLNKALVESASSEDADALLSYLEQVIRQLHEREKFERLFFGSQPNPPSARSTAQPPPADPAPPPNPAPKKTSPRKKKRAQDDPYTVLGVNPGASDEEIKKAYRQKIALTHPDKVAHLSEKLRKTADKETRRIKAAYEALTKGRDGV